MEYIITLIVTLIALGAIAWSIYAKKKGISIVPAMGKMPPETVSLMLPIAAMVILACIIMFAGLGLGWNLMIALVILVTGAAISKNSTDAKSKDFGHKISAAGSVALILALIFSGIGQAVRTSIDEADERAAAVANGEEVVSDDEIAVPVAAVQGPMACERRKLRLREGLIFDQSVHCPTVFTYPVEMMDGFDYDPLCTPDIQADLAAVPNPDHRGPGPETRLDSNPEYFIGGDTIRMFVTPFGSSPQYAQQVRMRILSENPDICDGSVL